MYGFSYSKLIMKKYSIVQNMLFNCYKCGIGGILEEHHIFYGKNRKNSDIDRLVVYLCPQCHRGTNGVHGKNGAKFDKELKAIAEQKWLDTYNKTIEDFVERYKKNYL